MSFGKLKAALKGLINRRDLTDALAADFVTRAVGEIERSVRLAPMEQLLVALDWDGTNTAIAIPTNYLELLDIFTDSGPLVRVEKAEYFGTRDSGPPRMYLRAGGNFLVRPTPPAGSTIYVQFYGTLPTLVSDEDENFWTQAGFNAVLYGAAALASDYFQMEDQYVQRFQGKSDALVTAMVAQDGEDRFSGILQIQPPSGVGCF